MLVLGAPLVLPAMGVTAALLLAVRRRVPSRGEWWAALLGGLALPVALLVVVVELGWLGPSAGSAFLWMGLLALCGVVWAVGWFLVRWRPPDLFEP